MILSHIWRRHKDAGLLKQADFRDGTGSCSGNHKVCSCVCPIHVLDKFCGYEELASYTGSRERCQQAGGIFVQSNSHCFKRIEPGTNGNLNYGCNGIYSYRTQAGLGSTQNGCFELKQREYGCKNAGEGYSMNYTTHNCVKTIDATLN